MEGEWSYYGGGQFKGERIVIVRRCQFREGECTRYGGGQFNGGRIVMLRKWSV